MPTVPSSVGSIPIQENASSLSILKDILVMSLPLGLAAMAQISIATSHTAMVGRLLGGAQLGAVTMAFGLINATAFACAAGFCGALETILSHSYGRDPHSKLYGTYGQRMTLMLLLLALIIGPFLLFADLILKKAGQNPEVTHYTGIFCAVAIFGVFPAMMLELVRRYYACQHLNNPLSVNLIISAALNPVVVFVCVKALGFYGAPLSWVILMLSMPGSLIAYLYFTGKYKQTWGGWNKNALMHWKPLLRLALPSMAMMMSEWASLEVNCLMAGFGTTRELAAFSIVYQFSGVFWSFASGSFIVAAVLVGNALGQGRARLARRSAVLCLVCAAGFGIFDICVVALFRNYIPLLFTSDPEVVELFLGILPFFCVYHFFDCFQSCMMGVFRGCGMQRVGAICITLVFSVIGVPLGVLLFFFTNIGVKALWIGPAFGVTFVGAPVYVYIFMRKIKWDEIHVAQEDLPSLDTSVDEMRSITGGSAAPRPHSSVARAGSEGRSGEDNHDFDDDEGDDAGGGGGYDGRALHSEVAEDDLADNTSFANNLAYFRVMPRSVLNIQTGAEEAAAAARKDTRNVPQDYVDEMEEEHHNNSRSNINNSSNNDVRGRSTNEMPRDES